LQQKFEKLAAAAHTLLKTQTLVISKFQFDPEYRQALYHEPLARVIAQALPVFGVKFTFTAGQEPIKLV